MEKFTAKIDDIHSKFVKRTRQLNCGLISGLLQAGVFNPWDRALYLSVMYHRPFLRKENFLNPMQGVMQTIVQRAISGGLYFPLEEIYEEIINKHLDENNFSDSINVQRYVHFVAGIMAGSTNGLILNPFTSVKFYYWGKAECGKESFWETARDMYRKGGIRPFFVGSGATVLRDLIFGGFFALCRHEQLLLIRHDSGEIKQPTKVREFAVNVIAATVATLLSSPVNYVRNIHYATPPGTKPKDSLVILKDLMIAASKEPGYWEKFHHIQNRLRIGWGTARVGFGMGFSAYIYNICSKSSK